MFVVGSEWMGWMWGWDECVCVCEGVGCGGARRRPVVLVFLLGFEGVERGFGVFFLCVFIRGYYGRFGVSGWG